MVLVLTLFSGIAWTLVYAELVRLGFTQRTYGMPVVALGLNLAWEWVYAMYGLLAGPGMQTWVNLVWGLADLVVLATFWRFGRKEFAVGRATFTVGTLGVLALSFAVQLLFLREFGAVEGAKYSAFLQNLLMSGLFVAMFLARGGSRGQSLLVAVAKWVGTLAPTILIGVIGHRPFITGIGALCSVVDLAYVALLLADRRRPGAAAA